MCLQFIEEKKLFEKYTIKTITFKIKTIQIGNNEFFLRELSKKQKITLKAIDNKENTSVFHSY